jgi:vacuolar protein sorting-associated protein 33A
MPPDLAPQDYAIQCIAAAEASRLNPYALHHEEYLMLRNHISIAQVTTYLNIRNGILRLWVKNPKIAVARDEALGCAKDSRWFDAAAVCYEWLVRRGYINFGCVQIRLSKKTEDGELPRKNRRRVIVIGGGMSGLGCARHLDGLFKQFAKRFRAMGEEPPEVMVLEGRNRIGGRVYSRAFHYERKIPTPGFENLRTTAEMGGMIITGFERGNPINVLVRAQLGLPYHALRSEMAIYDSHGKPVDTVRDELIESLYNDCLDRVSEYKFKAPTVKLIEGNRDLMDEGKDSSSEGGHKTIAFVEDTAAAQPHAPPVSQQNIAPQVDLVPISSDRVTGKTIFEPGTPGSHTAAHKAKLKGWTLRPGVVVDKDLDLDDAAARPGATLGSLVDEAITQYKDIVELGARDFRLFNWHVANLEYSNAINYHQLSLQGWDIDAGNEWDGKHTMVCGGYQSVPRGLLFLPTPLSLSTGAAVRKITYTEDGPSPAASVECEDGQIYDADYVVNTIPLGVLKHGNVQFEPPLPEWKTGPIERLGFGVLNKVILVYAKPFWDGSRDIFGVLRQPDNRGSQSQKDYRSSRGRLFQWFNVSNTTGLPCLVGLMAGDAALAVEGTPDAELIAEATAVLRNVFGAAVPNPVEAIVTRWASDKFARGSYSSSGPSMRADDYDIMAKPVGNLFFAGEHTNGSHPATVHGAYLSGLRAASEVLETMLGPISVPVPLILPRESALSLKRKAFEESKDPRQARLEAYEVEIYNHIISKIGDRPFRPAKVACNAYVLFSKANYDTARKKCEEGRRPGKGKPVSNEVRAMASKMWKQASPEERQPFEEQAEEQKKAYGVANKEFNEGVAEWDRRAQELRTAYEKDHPSLPTPEEVAALAEAGAHPRRSKQKVESYAESESEEEML